MEQVDNDDIDMRELFMIIKERKRLIYLLTTAATLFAIIYVYFIAKPLYQGTTTLEMGKIVNKEFYNGQYSSLDYVDIDDLKTLVKLSSKVTGVSTSNPKKTKLITLTKTSYDKSTIKKDLEKAIKYILDRHKKLAELYSSENAKIKMTKLIGNIIINEQPIKPKKGLVITISFITSLIFSIFLVFFLNFLETMKREDD